MAFFQIICILQLLSVKSELPSIVTPRYKFNIRLSSLYGKSSAFSSLLWSFRVNYDFRRLRRSDRNMMRQRTVSWFNKGFVRFFRFSAKTWVIWEKISLLTVPRACTRYQSAVRFSISQLLCRYHWLAYQSRAEHNRSLFWLVDPYQSAVFWLITVLCEN